MYFQKLELYVKKRKKKKASEVDFIMFILKINSTKNVQPSRKLSTVPYKAIGNFQQRPSHDVEGQNRSKAQHRE